MMLFKLLMMSLISMATTDLRVLFFTMDSCPPCKQTEPHIDRLQSEGVSVSKIDVREYTRYAQQCQVQTTPTVMVVNGNQVLARYSGAMGYSNLRTMIEQAQASLPSKNVAPTAQVKWQGESSGSTNSSANKTAENANESNQPGRANRASWTQPAETHEDVQVKAHRATVRFRVVDREGTSFATGTIIHRNEGEALVLTCGHVFRDSNGQGKIHADLGFAFGQKTTVTGSLLYYDAKKHDIALVAIPCPLEIDPIAVAPEALAVQTGDHVFSLGCDRGADPTVRQSVLKAVTRYSGVAKYDTVGRPIDGRSGGGLFSAGGQLIGVCNAAAVEVDEGIYTGLQSIYWQFAKTNLTHLFRHRGIDGAETRLVMNGGGDNSKGQGMAVPSSQANTQGLQHPGSRAVPVSLAVARNGETKPRIQHPTFRGDSVPVNHAIFRGDEVPVRQAGGALDATSNHDVEMIVILRSRHNARQAESYTIADPTPEQLHWVRQSGSKNVEHAETDSAADRLARLPNVPRPEKRNEQYRAQSPR